MADKLPIKQKAFIDYYLADPNRNATQAYFKAYPNVKKVEAANTNASRLLSSAKVQAYLESELERLTKKVKLEQERVLQEIANVAFCDPAELINEAGELKPLHELPLHVRCCIQSLDVVTRTYGEDGAEIEYIHKIKFHPKMQALDMAMKYFGAYAPDRHKHEVDVEVTHKSADDIPFDRIRQKAIEAKAKRVG